MRERGRRRRHRGRKSDQQGPKKRPLTTLHQPHTTNPYAGRGQGNAISLMSERVYGLGPATGLSDWPDVPATCGSTCDGSPWPSLDAHALNSDAWHAVGGRCGPRARC